MVKRRRARVLLFGALALVAALVPAGLAAGSHDGSTATSGQPSVVYLTLGRTDQVTWEGETELINIRNNNCSVTFASTGSYADLLDIIPFGGQLGAVKDGFGVKSGGDGTGEPCGRVEASDGEAISVSLGSDLDGYLMTAIDVDLELKFNAMVDVKFYHESIEIVPARVTGFTGSGGSDDGPDSGDGDNFRLYVRPTVGGNPVLFDKVEFVPTAGAMSLEGGADGTENSVELDTTSNSSQFQVVQSFDGQITCGGTVTIDDAEFDEVVGVITMQALDLDTAASGGWVANCTELKNYNENVTASSLLFAPVLENSLARYTMILTLHDQPITTDGDGQTTSLIMEYNDGTFGAADRTLQPCLKTPEDSDYVVAGNNGVLPTEPVGEFACYYGVTLTPTGENVGREVWSIYFEDDPGFSFR